jgi:transcriptional regulator with XRE-family HTH domain
MNFSHRFEILVRESPLNQKALAAQLGVTESAIVNYKGGRTPKAEELLRIAKHFGVSMEYLLTGGGVTSGPAVDEAIWKQKAEHAEQKLEMLKSAMQGWLKKF